MSIHKVFSAEFREDDLRRLRRVYNKYYPIHVTPMAHLIRRIINEKYEELLKNKEIPPISRMQKEE